MFFLFLVDSDLFVFDLKKLSDYLFFKDLLV